MVIMISIIKFRTIPSNVISNLDMARDKGGQGMKAPPVVKYRKNIGTYQRESTNKEVKRVYRDRADARKG